MIRLFGYENALAQTVELFGGMSGSEKKKRRWKKYNQIFMHRQGIV